MAGTEKDDYRTFKAKVFRPNDRVDRIENLVVAGQPDINYCIEGIEGWVELKSPKEPKRISTPLFGSNHKLSIDQRNWFLRQKNAEGIGFILIATDVRWILIDGKNADIVNTATVDYLVKIARWWALKPIGPEYWLGLKAALSNIEIVTEA